MKELQSPYEIMEKMVEKLQENYPSHKKRLNGTIQFYFTHNGSVVNCYIESNKEQLKLFSGLVEKPTVSVKSTFYNWLKLASGKLNPIIGVITGKMKFKGDISFFKIIPKKINNKELGIPEDPYTKFESNPAKNWKIPEKVIVLNASARGDKGYTDFYIKPFINGLKENSDVEVVYLKDYEINPCKGCFYCWMNKPGECIYDEKDSFKELADKMSDANLIVYAFPIYADHIPGVLKNYFDRSVCRAYPYLITGEKGVRHPRKIIKENQSMFIFSVCGFFEMNNFIPVKEFFKALSHNRHCPIVGEFYRPTALGLYSNPFHFEKLNNILESLKDAGKEVSKYGKLKRKTRKVLHQHVKTDDNDIARVNEWWNSKKGSKDYNY